MKVRTVNRKFRGYTIMELVIVILIVAVLAAVAIPGIGNIVTNSRIEATEAEMMEIVRAIMGDRDAGFLGYLAEMGDYPNALVDLYVIGAQSPYNPFTRTGWNGPYVDDTSRDGDATPDITQDAWGNGYVYDKAGRTLTSNGPDEVNGTGDDLVVTID